MGEMPLESRRVQLSLNYWLNHSQDHPAQSTLKPCWEKERRETKSFGWTANQRAVQFRIDPLNVVPTLPMPIIPPWILPDATVDVSLLENKNRNKQVLPEYIYKFYMFKFIQMHLRTQVIRQG